MDPSPSIIPQRGEVWLANLDPIRGREQAGRRPVLVLSVADFNRSGADLVVVLPITSNLRSIPWHVPVEPPEGGLKVVSAIMCEAIRSVSRRSAANSFIVVNGKP
jgi:mRNA interferase MazF